MNKQALFDRFDASDAVIREKINDAFRDGEKAWKENLYELFGERKAAYILELLHKQI